MENTEIEKKIKDLKEFIKQKTDQGTANYLGKEIREICGMVETEQSSITAVSQQRELLIDFCTKLELKAKQYSYLIPDDDFIDEYLKERYTNE
jgi:hypothetical protein